MDVGDISSQNKALINGFITIKAISEIFNGKNAKDTIENYREDNKSNLPLGIIGPTIMGYANTASQSEISQATLNAILQVLQSDHTCLAHCRSVFVSVLSGTEIAKENIEQICQLIHKFTPSEYINIYIETSVVPEVDKNIHITIITTGIAEAFIKNSQYPKSLDGH